ncbi:MAG: hypothetical protein U0X39_09035 [Bacteroidales bacterium]
MRRVLVILFWLVLFVPVRGQATRENIVGKVSFISTGNVYVKFKTTTGIETGDTLFITVNEKLVPALVVSSKSSVSCLCTPLGEQQLAIDRLVVASRRKPEEKPSPAEKIAESKAVIEGDTGAIDSVKNEQTKAKPRGRVFGSFSANSYSDFFNTGAADIQKFRYTLSLNATNIGGSRLSFETYVSFRHEAGKWQDVKADPFEALKIFALALRYDIGKRSNISLGRKINSKVASLGAIDGLQFETTLKNISLGLIAGARPDYINYGFNPALVQYGGYVSLHTGQSGRSTETSLAFMEQTNNFKTDRRFIYLQHTNSILKNLSFFGSSEIDLYKLVNDQGSNSPYLTSIYVSLNYRPVSSVSISGSYDARKNVVYYETYRTFNERIMESELRQGYRLSGNWRFAKGMIVGLASGYRFLKSDPRPSKNFNGFYSWSNVPWVNMSATVTGTYLESSYVKSVIAGLNLMKDIKGKVQLGAGYHFVDNKLPENNLSIVQHIIEANLFVQVFDKTSFSATYEGTIEPGKLYHRAYIQLRQRF